MAPNVEALNLVQRVQLAWNLMRDERVSAWIKRVGPAAILAYVISPVDLIPDFLLGAGQVDDVGVIAVGLMILLRMLVRFAPTDVVEEHIRRITGSEWSGGTRSYDATTGETIDTSGRVRH